jgi:hypothetical protein
MSAKVELGESILLLRLNLSDLHVSRLYKEAPESDTQM